MTEEQTTMATNESGGGKGLAIAALILGIAAFFPGCCASGFYGQYVIAVLAIIFGGLSLGGPAAGMAKAGLTLGIIAVVLYIVAPLVLGEAFMDFAEKMQQEQQNDGSSGSFNNDFNNDGNNFDGDGSTGSNDGDTPPATTGN